MSSVEAANWDSLIESDELGIESLYRKTIVSLASFQHLADVTAGTTASTEAPDLGEPEDVMRQVELAKAPPWWPKRLPQISFKIKAQPEEGRAELLGPFNFDPNTKDFGQRGFISQLKQLIEPIGTPFDGTLHLIIFNKSTKDQVSGWKGAVSVGPVEKKDGKKKGSGDAIWQEKHTKYLEERDKEQRTAMLQMFGTAAHNLQASAQVIQATRGVNVAPPWMNGEDDPVWMKLGVEAMSLVGKALGYSDEDSADVKNKAKQVTDRAKMQRRELTMNQEPPRALMMNGDEMNAIDPGGPPQDGEFEGPSVPEGIIVEDEFQNLEEEGFENGFDAEDVQDAEIVENPAEEDEEEEEESEEESDGADPLSGRSDEEVVEAVEKWLANHPDKKKLKNRYAMRLAKNFM